MSRADRLQRMLRGARRRRAVVIALHWLPWLLVLVAIAARGFGVGAAIGAAVVTIVAIALHASLAQRVLDRAWLTRQLDTHDAQLQDSSDLLFVDPSALNPLQRLQQARIGAHLEAARLADVREPIAWPRLRNTLFVALLLTAALWLAPTRSTPPTPPPVPATAAIAPPAVQSMQSMLAIAPPSYTGLPPRELDVLDATAEQGSTLAWTLRFAIEPNAARLRFIDGEATELVRGDTGWHAARAIDTATLYRIELDGAPLSPDAALYRIDVTADRAPQLKVETPERTLTILDAASARWPLVFDASDDYGLGPMHLELTLAQGSGEQVTVSERRIALRGRGDARAQRVEHAVDLAALGFAQGDDLIARIVASDRREPMPNVSRSASFILRWPPSQGSEGTGVDGLVQQAMPAYFRSQRQIIIDTEALIAERPSLDADTALARADTIGADQRILRLRYGQFLGEESEGGEEDHHEDEHHDGAPADTTTELMRAAGHLHDLPEAATLLDSATRELLRSALNEMWSAERELRSGNPVAALPYEQRALDFIKRVQQADRIYLARVGLELPALDATRRLTGERERGAPRRDPLVAVEGDAMPGAMWTALQTDGALPLDAFATWLRTHPQVSGDPLALLSDIDALQRDANCDACRTRLARNLWPLLAPPAAAPLLRSSPDAAGRAYLDAIAPTSTEGASP